MPNPEEKEVLAQAAPSAESEKFSLWTFLKQKKWLRILLIVILSLSLVGASGAVILHHLMNGNLMVDGEQTESDDGVLDEEIATRPEEQDQYMNILLCGVDYKENTSRGKLTDVMMVVHLDFVEQTIDILQLPRDSYIGTEYSTGKLNAIYGASTNGGIENLARKINSMLQISLDNYVVMNMDGFESIVDTIGGVTVDSPYTFTLEGVTIQKGEQTLNGKQANKFVRERKAYAAGDLTRMQMQQIFFKAFVKKCLSLSSTELIKLIPQMFQYLTTDMTVSQVLDLYGRFSNLTSDDLQFHSCEVTAFTDPYDKLSKLSLHAKPIADLLNTYFRENGETLNWTELNILEYDTSYAYEGEQNQYSNDTSSSTSSSTSASTSSSYSGGSSSSSRVTSSQASSYYSSSSRINSYSSSVSSHTESASGTSSAEESSLPESSEPESSDTTSAAESGSEASSAAESAVPSSEPAQESSSAVESVSEEDTAA